MRVSIWQQFSSNHSSRFTVVGRFTSLEEANAAAGELRDLIAQVEAIVGPVRAAWRRAIKQTKSLDEQRALVLQQFPDLDELRPTQPEKEFSNTHNVEWNASGIDWLWGDYEVSELVKVVDSDVFVMSNDEDSYWYPTPIVTTLVRLGARSTISERDDDMRGFLSRISVALSCTTPDQETGNQVVDTIKAHLDWASPKRKIESVDDIEMAASDIPWIPDNAANRWDYQIVGGFRSAVKGQNKKIECYIQFGRTGCGLPAMVKWLEDLGCIDIEYRLTEDREEFS